MFLKSRKAQSTLEYTVLVVVVIAALTAMSIYFKRASQGGIRESIDGVGQQFDLDKTAMQWTIKRRGGSVQRTNTNAGNTSITYTFGDTFITHENFSGAEFPMAQEEERQEHVDAW